MKNSCLWKFTILTLGFIQLNSCVEDDLFLDSSIGNCEVNIRKNSPYQKLVFFDDFIPNHADPCYSDQSRLTCRVRPDWGMGSRSCAPSINKNKYKDLNKCTWVAFSGWNFWEKNWNNKQSENLSSFDDEAFEIKDGYLILKTIRNPSYNPSLDNCGQVNPNTKDIENYYGVHCPIYVAGIDSKYFDERTPGRNMQFGRIEFKAKTKRYGNFDPLFSAIWLWPNDRGTGHPYKATSSLFPSSSNGLGFSEFGEIDVLEHNATSKEGFHSYVNWLPGQTPDAAATTESHFYTMDEERIYGLEWDRDKIQWYVNDCKVAEVSKGEISKSGAIRPLNINDIASYMILYSNLGRGFSAKDPSLNINSELLIDYISLYE